MHVSSLRVAGDAAAPIHRSEPVRLADRGLRACAPAAETSSNDPPCPHASCALATARSLALEFLVSRDEEYVRMYALRDRLAFDLGARNHNYLLLTLARRRLADAADGLPDAASGWIHRDDLAHDPSMAPPRLNLDVFRIRKQFAALGLADAHHIVERRPSTREIRIGTGRIAIRPV